MSTPTAAPGWVARRVWIDPDTNAVVAGELGYSSARPLLERLRRMNHRTKGEAKPFQITSTPGANCPYAGLMLRQAEATL